MISMTAGLPVCAPSPNDERVDSGGALRATTLPWRPRRRFIPTIARDFLYQQTRRFDSKDTFSVS